MCHEILALYFTAFVEEPQTVIDGKPDLSICSKGLGWILLVDFLDSKISDCFAAKLLCNHDWFVSRIYPSFDGHNIFIFRLCIS